MALVVDWSRVDTGVGGVPISALALGSQTLNHFRRIFMSRWKVLCALLSGVLLMASAWAQNPSSVVVTENGQLWEKTVINGRLEQKPLSGSNTVMYLYGRAPVTGEILFAQDENNKMK